MNRCGERVAIDIDASRLEALERWLMLGGQLVVTGGMASGFPPTESGTGTLRFGMGTVRASDPAPPMVSDMATTILAGGRA